jgi:hypothetical protein
LEASDDGDLLTAGASPNDLMVTAKGRKVTILADGTSRGVTLGETVKMSLGTKEPKIAKEVYRDASAAV